MSSSAAPYNITIDRGSDWSKTLTLSDNNGNPVAITNIFTVAVSITGTTSPSVAAASLTYVSTDLWSSDGNATVPGSGTWIRVRRSGGAWEITRWVNGAQATGYWTSSSNPNHPAWVETWVAVAGATGSPVVDSAGVFFEGSISLQERGPDVIPFSFDTVGDGSAGQVEISLSRSYTRALANSGAYRFDWFVYHGRERIRLVAGRISAQGSSTGTSTGIPIPAFGSSPSVAWGNIIGTLSDQTDLQAALDAISSGASTFAELTDKATADLPTINTPLASALSSKAATSHTHLSADITDATNAATPSTLVRRNSNGNASFGALDTSGLTVTGGTTFGDESLVQFDAVEYYYGAGAASAHRTALNGGAATGDALFQAATPAAARTTLGFDAAVPKIPIAFSNSSDFPTASTSFVNVTGLSFPVLANKSYSIYAFLLTNKNDANGLAVQFTGPASPAKLFFRIFSSTTSISGGAVNDFITAFSSPTSAINTVNGDGFLSLNQALFTNGANAGTVQLQLRAVTGGTAKIYAGSYLVVTEL